MNTLFLTATSTSLALGFSLALADVKKEETVVSTKKQKIEQLFELMNDKQMFAEMYEPIFASTNITDATVKQEIIDTFLASIKDDYVTVYNKIFSETEIDDQLKFYQSTTGQRIREKTKEIGAGLQKAYSSIMTVVQDVLAKTQEKISSTVNAVVDKVGDTLRPDTVIHFDKVAKGKTDEEVRELFNKEIQHDGITVVKFSALWCSPCKTYEPIFDEVAEQLKELNVDGKKILIKYLAIDIDAVPVIAKDCSIMSIPATIFYKNGKKVDSKAGSITKNVLSADIQKVATSSSSTEKTTCSNSTCAIS
jgi:thioredoxin 1